jgi:hypothetical protein
MRKMKSHTSYNREFEVNTQRLCPSQTLKPLGEIAEAGIFL